MHHTPYTTQVLDAVMASQLGIGCMIFALLWFYRIGAHAWFGRSGEKTLRAQSIASFVLLTLALLDLVTVPVQTDIWNSYAVPISPE